jgi:hypothetical protein
MQQIWETCAMPNIYPFMMDFCIHERLKLATVSVRYTQERNAKLNKNVRENQLIIYQNVLMLMFWRNPICKAI